MLWAAPANADGNEDPGPPSPMACAAWQDRIGELAESSDPRERDLAEFYAQAEHQWCQTRRRRVPEEREPWFDLDFSNAELVAEIARWLAISLLLILVLWAAWRWRQQLARWLPRRSERPKSASRPVIEQQTRHRHDTPDRLDTVGEAKRLWQHGQQRDALALLYRDMLRHYLDHEATSGSLTEREALRALRQRRLPPERLAWCQQLIQAWLNTAWGRQPLTSTAFDALLAQWPEEAVGQETAR